MAETKGIERTGANGAGQDTPRASDGERQAEAPTPMAEDQTSAGRPDDSQEDNGKEAKKPRPLLWLIGGVVLVLALFFGIRFFLWNRTHVGTDDAYVTGNLVNVSPQINGTLMTLTVQEGDFVKKGQLIARLDPSGPAASLRQAQANYEAALSQVPQAERNLAYQELSQKASVAKAEAALTGQQAKTQAAKQQVSLTQATVSNTVDQARSQVDVASAQAAQADAQVRSAEDLRENDVQAVQTAQDALANARQQVVTSQRAARAADARVVAARAAANQAASDVSRYRVLYAQDAISAQAFQQAQTQAQNTAAQLEAAQQEADQAHSQVSSSEAVAAQSASQVEEARKTVAQATAQLTAARRSAEAAHEQVGVARAGLGVAQANGTQIGIQQSNLASAAEQTTQSEADLANAQAGKEQVAVRQKQVLTSRAQAAQAKAALTNAQITMGDTYIYAPCDGTIVRKDSNVGATMSPGTTIVTIAQQTSEADIWVDANFKETQLQNVRVGQPAEIDVDAFGGKVFRGRVESILEATGAATALLPPDNATGNFTKVVQRIPVRITFIPAQPGDGNYATEADIQNLRQGMSVTATIDTGSGSGH